MHPLEDTAVCVECGASIDPAFGRACARGDGTFLCFECALRRGGAWDEQRDAWRAQPREDGLPDARRPHP